MTKQDAIQKVETAFPSIFSKEDVINLINGIDEGNAQFDKDSLLSKIREAVEEATSNLDTDDVVDVDSVSFEIRHGNEITIESISINDREIANQIMELVEEVIDVYVDNYDVVDA